MPLKPGTVEVYRSIERLLQMTRRPPSLKEIGEASYLTTTGVVHHLKKLEEAGLIERQPYRWRSTRIVKPLPDRIDP